MGRHDREGGATELLLEHLERLPAPLHVLPVGLGLVRQAVHRRDADERAVDQVAGVHRGLPERPADLPLAERARRYPFGVPHSRVLPVQPGRDLCFCHLGPGRRRRHPDDAADELAGAFEQAVLFSDHGLGRRAGKAARRLHDPGGLLLAVAQAPGVALAARDHFGSGHSLADFDSGHLAQAWGLGCGLRGHQRSGPLHATILLVQQPDEADRRQLSIQHGQRFQHLDAAAAERSVEGRRPVFVLPAAPDVGHHPGRGLARAGRLVHVEKQEPYQWRVPLLSRQRSHAGRLLHARDAHARALHLPGDRFPSSRPSLQPPPDMDLLGLHAYVFGLDLIRLLLLQRPSGLGGGREGDVQQRPYGRPAEAVRHGAGVAAQRLAVR